MNLYLKDAGRIAHALGLKENTSRDELLEIIQKIRLSPSKNAALIAYADADLLITRLSQGADSVEVIRKIWEYGNALHQAVIRST